MDRLYPLAPSVWGVGEEIGLDQVAQVPLFDEFAGLGGSAFVPVLLHPNPLNGAWSVRRLLVDGSQGRVIGEIPWSQRGRYEDMRRVEASLLLPVTTAEIRHDAAAGLFRATVILPPPQLAVPRNDTAPGAAVLPPGDMVVVDTAAGEYSAEELAARSPGSWFVALHEVGGAVAATLGGKVLGGFAEADAAQLREFVRAAAGAGAAGDAGGAGNAGSAVPVYARAVLVGGMAALNVAGPNEGLQTVPALKVPDLTPTEPWSLVEFPDGTWAVTVERAFVADPDDTVRPRHTARYVSLAGRARPEEVAAPTEMFELPGGASASAPEPRRVPATGGGGDGGDALAGAEGYLTEVEKVRLRRQRRAAGTAGTGGTAGRHRR